MTKEDMAEFTSSLGFIVFFLIMCLVIAMFAGEKPLFWFLVLILIGMVTVNWGKINAKLIMPIMGGS